MRTILWAVFAAMLSMSVTPANALLGEAAVECRAAIAKNYGKLLNTANKTIASCHKSRDKDVELVGTDCNDMTAADAAKGKYAGAVTKFVTTITDACGGEPASTLTAASVGGEAGESQFYVSCPVTSCAGVGGVIDNVAELASCLGCQAEAIAEDVGMATLGLPNPANLDSDEQKCHGAIAKGYAKYLSTGHKNETACQGDQDEAGNYSIAACDNTPAADTKGKTAGSLTKAAEGLDKSCPVTINLADLDGCAADTLVNLKTCTGAAWGSSEDDAFATTYEMPATGCPSAVRTTILGGCSTEGSVSGICSSGFQSGTVLSVGWKGLGHGADMTDKYTVALDVTCPGSVAGACGTCLFTGLSFDNPRYNDFTRCLNDSARPCDTPFSNDLDCGICAGGANIGDNCTANGDCPGSTCSAGACKYFLGPPMAVSASGTSICTLNVANIIGGTVDPDLGTADFDINLRSVVHRGVSQTRPCPYCRYDTVPLDGVTDGTCFEGPHDGDPCDVQGFDFSFALTKLCVGGTSPGAYCGKDADCTGGGTCEINSTTPHSGNSLDCPPSSVANVSGSGLSIQIPLTTGVSSKDATDPCESPNEALDCYCGVCSGDSSVSCNSDSECSLLLLGNCGPGNPPGVNRMPNLCSDGHCTPTGPTDRGLCMADVDSYCSGMLLASGHGVIVCGTNADCTAYETGLQVADDWVCPGDDCGQCTVQHFRSCFLDPMSVSGTPDPANPVLAGTFCVPPTSNGSVNSTFGLPGPGTLQTKSIVDLRYY